MFENKLKGKTITSDYAGSKAAAWLGLFLPFLLVIPNIILDFTENWSVIAKIINVALPLGIYTMLMSLWKNVGRTALFMIPVMFFAAFQIVLIFLYGGSIIAVDMLLNVVTTNAGEVAELLSSLLIAISVVVILYVPVIILGIVFWIKGKYSAKCIRHRQLAGGCIITAMGTALLIVAYATVDRYDAVAEIFPANVVRNVFIASNRVEQTRNYAVTSADFSYRSESLRPDSLREVYVLVVGETSRADNWQILGYDRPTNPRLQSRGNEIIAFPRALSESNTTHKSVPLMLSWLTAENFGDSISTTKGIISAFKEAGYKTAYFSNQGRNHSFIDFFGEEADTVRFLTDDDHAHFDTELLPALRHFINDNQHGKQFIVLHTYGSHFNYIDRYDNSHAVFSPFQKTVANASNRPNLINSYNNTIVATDYLLDEIISSLDSLNCQAAMIYASDHGEDIFDDSRKRFLHASPVPTYWQLHVPMVMWMSNKLKEVAPGFEDMAQKHASMQVSTSSSVFPTMLVLAGIDTPYLDYSYSLVSPEYMEKPRSYVNDLNKSVGLKTSGLKKVDFDLFKKFGISVD